jgi:monoterpene epsilon-lactone hydrolase
VLYPGEAGAGEAMLMAAYGRIRCISVDYRMPPDFLFPAAIDDVTAVWSELARRHDPSRMGVFGTSAGGALTLSLVQRAKREGLPLPAAIAAGTPWADLAAEGDTIAAHAYVDNVLVSETGWLGAAASLYAGGRDLKDPPVSPIHGDFSGFPPTILTSGTRDLLLSDTVRVHRALRRAGVEAALQVFEGQSHAQFLAPFVPETEEALREIALFLGRYLAS